MDKTDKLEACPWCLGPARLTSTSNGDAGDGYMWRIACAEDNDCAVAPELYYESEELAVTRWNTRSRASVAAPPPTIYADGFCAQCSELMYPLTRALEKTGVPTGEDNWQQTYGPNKVRALADLETCLRRLLLALENGKPEEIQERIQWANHYIEFHAAVRRRLTALAQGREPEPEPSSVAATVDAETPPRFSLDDVVQHLNRVLGLLESIEDHSGKMSVQEPLPKARVILRGLIGHCALQATARHYFCSCGGALTAEEYIEHYFEKGHDHGDPAVRFQVAAAEIVKRFDLVAKVTQRNTVITDEIAAILSKHLGSAAVGEQNFVDKESY